MQAKSSTIIRLTLALACVAVTQLAVAHLKKADKAKAENAVEIDVTQLPLELENWQGTAVEADPQLFKALGALSMVDRSYSDLEGRSATVHLSTFPVDNLSLPHPPQLCYPGAGWQIVADEWKNKKSERPYKMLIVQQGDMKAAVAYWYQIGPYVSGDRSDLRAAFQKIRQEKEWPRLVKVLIQTTIKDSDSEGQATVESLGAQIYEWIKSNSERK